MQAAPERRLQTIERADTEYPEPRVSAERADEIGAGLDRDSGVQPILQLGPYRVRELIGSGAMGNVYEAEHVLLGRRVAIKMLRDELAGSRALAQRMFAEARASNLIGNEHIVQVLDLGCEPDGTTWFAMELLEGQSLADLLDRQPLSVDRALDLARQVCEALIPVHDAGIVHRDIKPENVFVVDREGTDFVKLLDFGIARLPEQEAPVDARGGLEVVLGTPPYMAPEQVFGGAIDARSDLYAVGALLFELLSGKMLFERESMTELLAAVVLAQPPLPSEHADLPDVVRAQIDCVVSRCLAKDSAERPANARELAGELAAISFCLQEATARDSEPAKSAASASMPAPAPALDGAVEGDLAAFDELMALPLPPRAESRACRRRAPALAACALAIGTWLVPASALMHVEPALQRLDGWVTGLLAKPPWRSTASAETVFEASGASEQPR